MTTLPLQFIEVVNGQSSLPQDAQNSADRQLGVMRQDGRAHRVNTVFYKFGMIAFLADSLEASGLQLESHLTKADRSINRQGLTPTH